MDFFVSSFFIYFFNGDDHKSQLIQMQCAPSSSSLFYACN